MTQEMILDALARCAKNDCGDFCPMKGKDWINRGLATCEAFADGETVEMPVELIEHVIKLLKAQEPVELDIEGNVEYDGHGSWWHVCGACRQPIDKGDKFCRWCGRAVKWE